MILAKLIENRGGKHTLMRFIPIVSRARVDLERHLHRDRRHRGVLHHRLDHGQSALDLLFGSFEDKLVMYLKQHAG